MSEQGVEPSWLGWDAWGDDTEPPCVWWGDGGDFWGTRGGERGVREKCCTFCSVTGHTAKG